MQGHAFCVCGTCSLCSAAVCASRVPSDGREVFNFLRQEGIQPLIIMEVRSNMRIQGRSSAIRPLTPEGYDCVLVRNLTDSMHNPAMPPHVSPMRAPIRFLSISKEIGVPRCWAMT